MPTTAEQTEAYILKHPSIKDCLKKGIVNYSALSRLIAADLGIEKKMSKEAILMASLRMREKLKKEQMDEEKILHLLKNAELEFKNKMFVLIAEKQAKRKIAQFESEVRNSNDCMYSIEGTKSVTIIASGRYLEQLKKLLKNEIIKLTPDVVLVTIKTNEDIEKIKGIMATVCTALYENNINIIEAMSCWTDTMFVIQEEDLQGLMEALRF